MDRRKMLTMLGVSPALVVDSPVYARSGPRALREDSSTSSDGRVTVLNPGIPDKLAIRYPLASPLDTLENKTIYMINLAWEGPDAANYFYDEMRERLAKQYPGIKTVVKVTADGFFGSDPGILKEMASNKADGAIVGVAG